MASGVTMGMVMRRKTVAPLDFRVEPKGSSGWCWVSVWRRPSPDTAGVSRTDLCVVPTAALAAQSPRDRGHSQRHPAPIARQYAAWVLAATAIQPKPHGSDRPDPVDGSYTARARSCSSARMIRSSRSRTWIACELAQGPVE